MTSPTWPADKVERWPLDKLVPYARNARTHSAAQIKQIAASMREWGWTNPVLVGEDGTIIAGHGRIEAARSLGFTEAPVMIAVGWTDAQKRAYVIADNKLPLNAGWDDDLLAVEIDELKELGTDISLLGFSDKELASIVGSPDEPDASPQLDGMQYRIVIDCTDEAHQRELLEVMEQQGLKCRPLIS